MQRLCRVSALAAMLVAIASCATEGAGPASAGAPFTAKLIAFNDYHGNLESPGTLGENADVPPGSRPPVGGAEFLAAHVAKLKARNPLNVVVSAGDSVGASPVVSALFFDEPAVETLNRIGLEFNAVGNHEFDKGSAELLRLQGGGCKAAGAGQHPNSCKGAAVGTPVPFEGAKFKWLAANVIVSATGQPLLPAYGIKDFNGVKVAFIGMTLKATPTIVSPTGVAGLSFRDEADTVNALVPVLRAQGIEAIVVLIHEGGVQSGSLLDINGCEGKLAGSPIESIVRRLDDAVDLVISGHTHAAYNCRLPNAKGRQIPVSSASSFGRVLTEVDLTIDPRTRDITAAAVANRLVVRNDPAVSGNALVSAIVTAYKGLVAPIANQVVGSISAELPNARVDGACNMPAGELVADAMLAATQAPGLGGAQIALTNGGGVRNPGFRYASSSAGEGDGNVTYGEAFTVQPFGNSLVTLTLTAQDLKDVLEEQFAGCRGQSPTATRLMLPSNGFKYSWDGSKACNARIRNVTLRNGATVETIVDASGIVIDPARRYRVTVNSFMADGGDGYATFLRATDRLGGAQDIDALTTYLARFKAPAAPFSWGTHPNDAGSRRIQRVGVSNVCPIESNTNP